jgi:hypothetical protein
MPDTQVKLLICPVHRQTMASRALSTMGGTSVSATVTKPGRLLAGTLRLIGLGCLALSSCATTNRWAIGGMLDDCKASGDCANGCAEDVRASGKLGPGPGDSNYCDTLEIYRAESIVAGKGQEPTSDLRQDLKWMEYLCGEVGVTRACTARDGLRTLLAKAEATVASDNDRTASYAAEGQAISDAGTVCNRISDVACKAKCDSENNTSYCVAWAWRLRSTTPPPLGEERVYLKKACDGANQHACRIIPVIDKQIEAQARDAEAREGIAAGRAAFAQGLAAQEVEDLWSAVEQTADEIAQQMWLVRWARQNHREPEDVLQRITRKIAEVTQTKFCPAKAAFIAKTTATEFSSLAAAHCKDHAPVGSSEGNYYAPETSTQVMLTTQCQTVFASQCP